MPNFWGKEIAIALIIHRNTVNHVEKILNQRHNSYTPSMPVLDAPDHVNHVSKTENLAKFMVPRGDSIQQRKVPK